MPAVTRKAALVALCLAGCATAPLAPSRSGGSRAAVQPRREEAPPLRVLFKDGFALAEENGRQWRIAEVGRDEMLWAPDGQRFAYVVPVKAAPEAPAKAPAAARKGRKPPAPELPPYQIVVRNLRGDSVNAFPVYRPGKPSQLEWLDDRHIAYEAPPDTSGNAYVVHAVESGELLAVRRGEQFVWSPGKKRLAYIAGKRRLQAVKVDELQVWPREDGKPRGQRRIVSDLVWSPDGNGLAFIAQNGKTSRLIVLLVIDDLNGDLSWDLPRSAGQGVNKLFWAESKVFVGESSLKPRFAASWTRVR